MRLSLEFFASDSFLRQSEALCPFIPHFLQSLARAELNPSQSGLAVNEWSPGLEGVLDRFAIVFSIFNSLAFRASVSVLLACTLLTFAVLHGLLMSIPYCTLLASFSIALK